MRSTSASRESPSLTAILNDAKPSIPRRRPKPRDKAQNEVLASRAKSKFWPQDRTGFESETESERQGRDGDPNVGLETRLVLLVCACATVLPGVPLDPAAVTSSLSGRGGVTSPGHVIPWTCGAPARTRATRTWRRRRRPAPPGPCSTAAAPAAATSPAAGTCSECPRPPAAVPTVAAAPRCRRYGLGSLRTELRLRLEISR